MASGNELLSHRVDGGGDLGQVGLHTVGHLFVFVVDHSQHFQGADLVDPDSIRVPLLGRQFFQIHRQITPLRD